MGAKAALGICLSALALLAVPGLASASEFIADAEASISVSGSQQEAVSFTIDGASTECGSATLSGTLSEPSETLTVHPEFSECKAFGFLEASIATAGCNFTFHAGEETAEDEFAGTADVACEAGKSITITAATCKATIGSQTGIGGIKYTNRPAASPEDFLVTASLSKVAVTKTNDGFLCPFAGTGAATGTMSGSELMKGFIGAEQVGARVGRKTLLCKEQPTGNPLVCPVIMGVKQSYAGAITGQLKAGKTATFESIEGPAGTVTCTEVALAGTNFQKNGAGGSVTIAFSSNGGACTSNIAGMANVTVTMPGQPFNQAFFEYQRATGPQGSLRIRALKQLKLQSGGVTCNYNLFSTEGLVDNADPGVPIAMRVTAGRRWTFASEVPAGGGVCPKQLNWETVLTLERNGGGDLFLARQ